MNEIKATEKALREAHREAVSVSARIMRMAGAKPFLVDGTKDAAFWQFTDTDEHATIDAAIQRVGGHPAVSKLVREYLSLTKRMMAMERRFQRLSARASNGH